MVTSSHSRQNVNTDKSKMKFIPLVTPTHEVSQFNTNIALTYTNTSLLAYPGTHSVTHKNLTIWTESD